MTILGTRPEIIRLSLIIEKLDRFADEHILVHTGQNFTHSLSAVFFREMNIRPPDYVLATSQQSLGLQLAAIFRELELILAKEKPERVLVLGDTNSALSAVLAERMDIPVVHMEAGNRCYDDRVPEEKNRRVIDAISSINMPYTPRSRMNLLREGVPPNRIVLSGNPIWEVLQANRASIDRSDVLKRLSLNENDYMLVTIHRAENVDDLKSLTEIMRGLHLTAERYGLRMVMSVHPRTRSKLAQIQNLTMHPLIELHEPFGFYDFVKLEQHAACVLTDSGTVQEECCIFRIPAVTVRRTTERPETVDCGSNVVSGIDAERICGAVGVQLSSSRRWSYPEGYMVPDVSDNVVKFLSGFVPHRSEAYGRQ